MWFLVWVTILFSSVHTQEINDGPEIFLYDDVQYTELNSCSALIREESTYTTVKGEKGQACVANIVVPQGKYLKLVMADLAAYCEAITKNDFSAEMIDETRKTVIDLCENPNREMYTVPPGNHMIIYRTMPSIRLILSVSFINTDLDCGDRVTLDHFGVPVTLTNRNGRTVCTLFLPGSISLTVQPFKDTDECENNIRLRQGRAKFEMKRELKVCSLPAPKNYEMVCNAGSITLHSIIPQTIRLTVVALPNSNNNALKRLRC